MSETIRAIIAVELVVYTVEVAACVIDEKVKAAKKQKAEDKANNVVYVE